MFSSKHKPKILYIIFFLPNDRKRVTFTSNKTFYFLFLLLLSFIFVRVSEWMYLLWWSIIKSFSGIQPTKSLRRCECLKKKLKEKTRVHVRLCTKNQTKFMYRCLLFDIKNWLPPLTAHWTTTISTWFANLPPKMFHFIKSSTSERFKRKHHFNKVHTIHRLSYSDSCTWFTRISEKKNHHNWIFTKYTTINILHRPPSSALIKTQNHWLFCLMVRIFSFCFRSSYSKYICIWMYAVLLFVQHDLNRILIDSWCSTVSFFTAALK